jgi:hypothetical protein
MEDGGQKVEMFRLLAQSLSVQAYITPETAIFASSSDPLQEVQGLLSPGQHPISTTTWGLVQHSFACPAVLLT